MKLYILIDCQNDFCHKDGVLCTQDNKNAVKNIIHLLKNRVAPEDKVIVTYDTHYEDTYFSTLEGRKLPIKHCIQNTWGWQIHTDIERALPKDIYPLMKETFGSTSLNDYINLYYNNIDEIIVCGFATNICVISNVLMFRSSAPEMPITVIENACAGTTFELHKFAIDIMRSCQIRVENIF